MKAVCANTPSGGSVANGRVHRPRRDVENEEIQMYLSKLKELVPFMPRNRKLSKLEVIQYVIDYICDLQHLRTWRKFRHPTAGPCRAEGGSPRGRWPSICHHHRHRHHHPSSRAFENCTTIDRIAPIHPSINVSELSYYLERVHECEDCREDNRYF
ncbi:Protein extra-macrochaetae [Gryllus bimaculatus]|nr:Protein extra-macrochaetae [Gryllus bimaculatus]